MRHAIICLTAALIIGLGGTSAAAQSDGGTLTLEQEKILAEIRGHDRELFFTATAEAQIGRWHGYWIAKPIAKWTQDDFWKFVGYYKEEALFAGVRETRSFSEMETALFFLNLLQDGPGGDGGD